MTTQEMQDAIRVRLMDANSIPAEKRENLTVDFSILKALVYPEPFDTEWQCNFTPPPEGTPSKTKYGVKVRLRMLFNDGTGAKFTNQHGVTICSDRVGNGAIARTWADPKNLTGAVTAFFEAMECGVVNFS